MAEVRDAPKEVSENQRCEDNPCSAAHYSPLSSNLLRDIVKGTEQSCCAQAECSGPTGHAVGHVEFQRQRADISDGQSLTAGQYYYIIIKPRAALAGQCSAMVSLRLSHLRGGGGLRLLSSYNCEDIYQL